MVEGHQRCARVCVENDGAVGFQKKPCAGQSTDPNYVGVSELNVFSTHLPKGTTHLSWEQGTQM